MEINIYSIFTGIVFSNILIIVFIILLNNLKNNDKIFIRVLFFLITMIFFKLFIPIEIGCFSITIGSYKIIPSIINFFHNINFKNFFIISYLIIAFIKIIFNLYKYIYNKKFFDKNIVTNNKIVLKTMERIKKEYSYEKDIRIIRNSAIKIPCEFGLTKLTIILPNDDFTETELYFILKHEFLHYYNKNNIIKLLTTLLKCIFWINPFIYVFSSKIDEFFEINCDTNIVANLNNQDKLAYISCIVKIMENYKLHKGTFKSTDAMISILGKNNTVLKRIKLIYNDYVVPHIKSHKSAFIIVFLLTCTFSLFIIQPAYLPEHIEYPPNTISEEDYIIHRNNTYYLVQNGKVTAEFYEMPDEFKFIPVRKK